MIFSLVTSISNSLHFLNTVKLTVVHAGHFIQLMISSKEFSSFTSLSSTFIIISHHFNHAFSAGQPGIGEVI